MYFPTADKAPLKRGHFYDSDFHPSSTELRICPVRMNIDYSALIGLGSCIEMSVFSSWKLVSDSRIKHTVLGPSQCE